MYTSNLGMPELRQELSRHLKDNYNLEYDPDSELLITVGVSEGLDLAMKRLTLKLVPLILRQELPAELRQFLSVTQPILPEP